MTEPTSATFYIIGGGRTGASLAFFLTRQGLRVNGVAESNPTRLAFLKNELHWKFAQQRIIPEKIGKSQVIILAVRDDQIENIASQISRFPDIWLDRMVVHCSGTLPVTILSPLQDIGARVASLHPIYSFSVDPRENKGFEEVWFTCEAKDEVRQALLESLPIPPGKIFPVNAEQKLAVHLACVVYSNFFIALAGVSQDLLDNFSLSRGGIHNILRPLLDSSLEQVSERGISAALTGPIIRGDLQIITAHLHYLQTHYPQFLKIYILLSKQLLSMSGLVDSEHRRLENFLNSYEI